MLIDTHCHIGMIVNKEQFKNVPNEDWMKILEVIKEAENKGVNKIINVGTNVIDSQYYLEVANKYAQCYASLGIHPNDITSNWKSEVKLFDQILSSDNANKIVGIGETGLDFHYPNYDVNAQKDLFKAQIELALKYNRAIIVHSRDAAEETLDVLSLYKNDPIRGTIHCFSYDTQFAKEAIKLGFVLGIGGTVTYPKNNVYREAVKAVGLDNIILETDAPFLAPQIIRGKQNTPANISLVAQYLSDLLGVSYNDVSNKTTANSIRIFGLN